MIDFQEIAITVFEKQGVKPSEVTMTIPGDFVYIHLHTTPEHPGERVLGLNIRLDSDQEGNGTWPTRTLVRWPELTDATAQEAREIARLLAAAAEVAAAFDAATGAEEEALSYEESVAQNLEQAGLKVVPRSEE